MKKLSIFLDKLDVDLFLAIAIICVITILSICFIAFINYCIKQYDNADIDDIIIIEDDEFDSDDNHLIF